MYTPALFDRSSLHLQSFPLSRYTCCHNSPSAPSYQPLGNSEPHVDGPFSFPTLSGASQPKMYDTERWENFTSIGMRYTSRSPFLHNCQRHSWKEGRMGLTCDGSSFSQDSIYMTFYWRKSSLPVFGTPPMASWRMAIVSFHTGLSSTRKSSRNSMARHLTLLCRGLQ